MAKRYENRTHEELTEEVKALKAELNRKYSALRRIEKYAKSGNTSACKSAAGNALRRK